MDKRLVDKEVQTQQHSDNNLFSFAMHNIITRAVLKVDRYFELSGMSFLQNNDLKNTLIKLCSVVIICLEIWTRKNVVAL